MYVFGVSVNEDTEGGTDKILEQIMTRTFPNLMKTYKPTDPKKFNKPQAWET